jgi:hypothetical protein
VADQALSRRSVLALGGAILLPRRVTAAGTPKEEKRGSQRGKGLFIIENDFPFATGRYPPRVLDLERLPEQDSNKDVYNAWGKCVQVFLLSHAAFTQAPSLRVEQAVGADCT